MSKTQNFQLEIPDHADFYDALPRFTENVQGGKNQEITTVIKNFVWEDKNYRLLINPATVLENDGIYRSYLPGANEREIESILRIACSKINPGAGIGFYGSSMQKALNNKLSAEEIEHALNVLADSSFKLIMGEGSFIFRIISNFEQIPALDDTAYIIYLSSFAKPVSELFQDPEFIEIFWEHRMNNA